MVLPGDRHSNRDVDADFAIDDCSAALVEIEVEAETGVEAAPAVAVESGVVWL